MTNSMIPHSFVPGTKAKAGEVNENFISLANYIEQNKASASTDIEDIKTILETKADKTELINNHTVTEAETDLNNYKTPGTYIFSALYTPANIPKSNSGTLIVTGIEESVIKQIWLCDGENPEIFIREFKDSSWKTWYSHCGLKRLERVGYLKLPNGLFLEWGQATAYKVTYPQAFKTIACPVCMKNGFGVSHERSDTGFTAQSLTGFTLSTGGICKNINWIAFGY